MSLCQSTYLHVPIFIKKHRQTQAEECFNVWVLHIIFPTVFYVLVSTYI